MQVADSLVFGKSGMHQNIIMFFVAADNYLQPNFIYLKVFFVTFVSLWFK